MASPEKLALPFLTREMLAFEQGVAFSLFVSIQSRVAARISIRGITSEGVFSFNATPTADSLRTNFVFRVPNIPIFLNVTDGDDDLKQGDCYVAVSLIAEGEILQQLAAGYVYGLKAIVYPKNSIDDQRIGGGKIVTVESADPGAGSQISLSVPTGQTWNVHALTFQLVTDGTAANRRVFVEFLTSGIQFMRIWSSDDQGASQTLTYWASNALQTIDTIEDNEVFIGLPQPIKLNPGDVIATQLVNGAGGDNYGTMKVRVEQFFETS